MFNLPESNIHLAASADNKQQAITLVANALEQAGYVESGYLQGMLGREQQTSTFLGNGIAIPHGTLDTRRMVKNTGVQIFQFPQGIEWGEGNIAYVVIGIAARSDEHLALLRQLTHVLGDEDTAAKLATLTDVKKFRAILMGEADEFNVVDENISLDVDTTSLLTLIAINAGKLEQQSAVNHQYVSEVIANPALPLAQGLWVTDAVVGNQKNGLAFSRAKQAFNVNNKMVHGVVTVAYANEQIDEALARLLDAKVQQILLNGDSAQIAAALNGKAIPQATTQATSTASAVPSVAAGSVVGTFTVRNEHGLHARPSAILVNEVKKFTSQMTVENVTQGHRLRFVAEGEDAQAALEAIGKVIASGLGETISAVPPSEPDTIEVMEQVAPTTSEPTTSAPSGESAVENLSESVEGVFEVKNEHGLHARPAAILVSEVKKYNANVAVQNLDRNTPFVSAKSLMKVVALGVVKGHRLRFVATGEQAQQAIEGIGAAINAGLGE